MGKYVIHEITHFIDIFRHWCHYAFGLVVSAIRYV